MSDILYKFAPSGENRNSNHGNSKGILASYIRQKQKRTKMHPPLWQQMPLIQRQNVNEVKKNL